MVTYTQVVMDWRKTAGVHTPMVSSAIHLTVRYGGGAALTPGTKQEMTSLHAEHGGLVGMLLLLYALQAYIGPSVDPANYNVTTWIDNDEVLARGGSKTCGQTIKEQMVLDYNLWMVMTMLQSKIQFQLYWNKVNSHI